ncbi:hypothetical protein BGZ63DRAFT_271711 [Mariannaea sp. PMI_226]|nr:hypothetical protein BGZ63DRAFT_271711 [Mariannaea sp. PMI_226]
MPSATTTLLLFVALLGPYLWTRIQVLSLFISNSPTKLERMSVIPVGVKFADRIRNCEDALLVEEHGLAILSCDPGRDKWNTVMGVFNLEEPITRGGLWVYDYASGTDTLTELELVGYEGEDLHPLGLSFDAPTSKLFMVNHGSRGSRIEVFHLKLSGEQPVATHERSIIHPLINTPNSITAINGNEIYVTNDHYYEVRKSKVLALIETYAAIPGGNVVHFDLSTDTARVVARLPYANGIEFINDTTLAVSSTSTAAVRIYEADPKTHDLTFRYSFNVPFMPDNLSTDKNGVLLITGHPHPPSLTKYATTRALCNSEEGKTAEVCKEATPGTWISEWTAEGGRKDLFVDTWYPSGCTTARDVERKVGIATGLYGKGILVWKE